MLFSFLKISINQKIPFSKVLDHIQIYNYLELLLIFQFHLEFLSFFLKSFIFFS